MKSMSSITTCFILEIFYFSLSFGLQMNDYYDVSNLTTPQIIDKYGYPGESHSIETEDGFILEAFRIPFGKYSQQLQPGFPIVLEAGLFGSSDSFFLLGGEECLPFLLADEGFDVWIVNFRGNRYSTVHKYYTAEDDEYWDFSWHENGIYDLPAQIDYICNETGHEDLLFLGYSMGNTMFFVMASEKPEYQQKIRAAILFAPVAYLEHTKTPFRFIAPLANIFKAVTKPLNDGKMFEQSPSYKRFIRRSCTSSDAAKHICKSYIFYISGSDRPQLSDVSLSNLLTHMPGRTSVKTVVHYAQLVLSGEFRQYDYGPFKNKKKYKSFSPPDYDLEAATTPIYMFLGKNDYFSTPKDLRKLFERLPNIKAVDVVPYERFTHLDFIISKDVKTLLYDKVLERAREIIQNEEQEEDDYDYDFFYY